MDPRIMKVLNACSDYRAALNEAHAASPQNYKGESDFTPIIANADLCESMIKSIFADGLKTVENRATKVVDGKPVYPHPELVPAE